MTVWAVVDKHRVLSVWTTEEAAHRAADPEKRQIIVESETTADAKAWVSGQSLT